MDTIKQPGARAGLQEIDSGVGNGVPRGTLMIQGTTSDAGKSTFVAGLCRLARRTGTRVAPFKPQNMALNSAVAVDGGEIGRAQALQAVAAGIAAHTDLNPILLKPNTDTGAQLIVHGRALGNLEARAYHAYKPLALQAVLESYARLQRSYQALIVEGAGSPAEINLREGDIANMGFAEAVDCPVVVIADIDRGGVFAHLLGTLECLSESERARIKGFVINRFRGDVELLKPGLDWLSARTGKPVFGVVPYLHQLMLDAEDALPSSASRRAALTRDGVSPECLRVSVLVLPHLSNHTDFDALRAHPLVELTFVRGGQPWPSTDLVILPGSKNVRADLGFLRAQGWDRSLMRHLRYGGKVIGLCGGMQMLGRRIDDPLGIETANAQAPSSVGLSLLDFETTLAAEKHTENVSGCLSLGSRPSLTGYEIHAGRTVGPALERPALWLRTPDGERPDGARSSDDQILATYVHGLFDTGDACAALLRWAGLPGAVADDHSARREAEIDRLADVIEAHCDLPALWRAFGG